MEPDNGINPYDSPTSQLHHVQEENTSGKGKGYPIPDGIKGWSWGAFLLNWIWALCNRTWIGLFCLMPYVGFVMSFALGFKGREWAWQNKRWDSVAHFQSVQRKWSMWGGILIGGIFGLGMLAAILLPLLDRY